MSGKRCPACGVTKDVSEFYRARTRKDGRACYCKACSRERQIRYRANGGREKHNEWRRQWKAQHPEKYRQQNRDYYTKNKERLQSLNRANKERRKREDPEGWALDNRRYVHAHKARRNKARVGKVDLRNVLAKWGMVCHICEQPILEARGTNPGSLTFDHVVPLSKGGPHSEDNLRPAHHFCNTGKKDRDEYTSPFVIPADHPLQLALPST